MYSTTMKRPKTALPTLRKKCMKEENYPSKTRKTSSPSCSPSPTKRSYTTEGLLIRLCSKLFFYPNREIIEVTIISNKYFLSRFNIYHRYLLAFIFITYTTTNNVLRIVCPTR